MFKFKEEDMWIEEGDRTPQYIALFTKGGDTYVIMLEGEHYEDKMLFKSRKPLVHIETRIYHFKGEGLTIFDLFNGTKFRPYMGANREEWISWGLDRLADTMKVIAWKTTFNLDPYTKEYE